MAGAGFLDLDEAVCLPVALVRRDAVRSLDERDFVALDFVGGAIRAPVFLDWDLLEEVRLAPALRVVFFAASAWKLKAQTTAQINMIR